MSENEIVSSLSMKQNEEAVGIFCPFSTDDNDFLLKVIRAFNGPIAIVLNVQMIFMVRRRMGWNSIVE